ncbi:hypothetical protein SAMN05444390_102353 [Marinobacterium lutimaris]|uniref:Uncharacterized protein n=1 Tax=Marinobacterium lutimaris TaxID=568106 RepID=A0A1H6B490_9GAMM|nr:hypothetical protein SAMN05444390_102353 [Marinobacterium lutimaris]
MHIKIYNLVISRCTEILPLQTKNPIDNERSQPRQYNNLQRLKILYKFSNRFLKTLLCYS